MIAGAARAWLLRTAHRLILDRWRKRSPRFVDLSGVLAASTDRGPLDDAIAAEETRTLADALGNLPWRDRALLILREQHRLPLADVGHVLDMPIGTVKGALHRAQRRLCEALPDDTNCPLKAPSEATA